MTSRYRRGDAVTSAPEGEDFHFHGRTVVKRHLLRGNYICQPFLGIAAYLG